MGGANCAIVHCAAQKSKHKGLSFHKVPAKGGKDEWRRQLLMKINRQDKNFNPDRAHICSRHFSESCFVTGAAGRRRLIAGSLPTQYMPVQSVETPKPMGRRPPVPWQTVEEEVRFRKRKSLRIRQRVEEEVRCRRRKSLKIYSKACYSKLGQRVYNFCQKDLTMLQVSVMLHDYDAAVDSSTLDVKSYQTKDTRRRLRKVVRQDPSEAEVSSNSTPTSPKKVKTSDFEIEIEIDIAEDPTELLMRECGQQGLHYNSSAFPGTQLIRTEPGGHVIHPTAVCEKETGTEPPHASQGSSEFCVEVKQEIDADLWSDSTGVSTEHCHAYELDMEIKQENDADVCSYYGAVSTGQTFTNQESPEFATVVKQEKDVDFCSDSTTVGKEQYCASELGMEIKLETDAEGCSQYGAVGTEQHFASKESSEFSVAVKQENYADFCSDNTGVSTEQYYASQLDMEIKQEDMCYVHAEEWCCATELGINIERTHEDDLTINQHHEALGQCRTPDLQMKIKQEKDIGIYSGGEACSAESERFNQSVCLN